MSGTAIDSGSAVTSEKENRLSFYMNPKLIKDISASSAQIFLNQFLGLIIFLITSRFLPKTVYGEMNWSLAVLVFVTSIISLRLDYIVVRRVAAGQEAPKLLTVFTGHIVFFGVIFYLALLVGSILYPSFFRRHDLLLILAISQLLTFFSTPFKNVANGEEKFGYLATMSSIAALIRAIGLLVIISYFQLSIQSVLVIFIVSSLIELIVSWYFVTWRMRIRFTTRVRFGDYKQLLHESLPQIGVAVLMAGITRMDWILLGLFTTASKTAEYSFAYRVYELSPFPLLIIAPVLLSRFARYFSTHSDQDILLEKQKISLLVRTEMILATFIPLVLNIIWAPAIDSLTANKYGAINRVTFFILSCCIPFQYINNLLWSANFAQHRLKLIFRITFITFCVILVGDLVFIPLYNAKGAALVYLTAMVIEYINSMRSSQLAKIKELWSSLFICATIAAVSGFSAMYFFKGIVYQLGFASTVFLLLIAATRQFRKTDILYILSAVNRKKT